MKKIAIIQSNYIPWKGYFDIINDSDIFIFLDDVQYTNRDWRNRNKIKTIHGLKWLTIPVGSDTNRLICDVSIESSRWQKEHWETIKYCYSKAKYFNLYKDFFEDLYCSRVWTNLSELNQYIITHISKDILGINTKFFNSKDLNCKGKKQEKLINLIKKVEGNLYISGPSAQNYIDDLMFVKNQIQLVYKDYFGYPEYEQFYPPFEHGVTILDLIFHTGPDAPYYIWGWRKK
ncbi:hypothetical protein GRQ40_16640 [Anoxybacillus sp. PDR2]|uniref:WbqC family protein n=1 Tax=Anoxybacillus sp. PDR2 TaxID=1636720 RepID=UPI001319680A|nr:WbqC family protein [Anoxybacillus sp. PDR2]QHC05392.1 hypothetical protein GRQ40_16640 [Anoxybacillus sp. PDR2]